jgi:hypothetical protein
MARKKISRKYKVKTIKQYKKDLKKAELTITSLSEKLKWAESRIAVLDGSIMEAGIIHRQLKENYNAIKSILLMLSKDDTLEHINVKCQIIKALEKK